jgi:hypothetical protein
MVNWQSALQRQISDLVSIMLTYVKRTKIDHYQQNFFFESFPGSFRASPFPRPDPAPGRECLLAS